MLFFYKIKKQTMKKIYNKLIRDKIPQIIKKNNQKGDFEKLNKKEFQKALLKKLEEETKEVIEAKDNKEELINEISDIYEIIDAMIESFNLNKKEIIQKQKDKRRKRGGFKERIFLKSVEK